MYVIHGVYFLFKKKLGGGGNFNVIDHPNFIIISSFIHSDLVHFLCILAIHGSCVLGFKVTLQSASL